jgi:large subunit ribosomal protein L9
MKIILLRDVAKIGRRNSVVEVPDGFALNRLIPSKAAEAATPTNLRRLEEKVGKVEAHNDALIKQVEDLAIKLETLNLVIPIKANDQGHLYESLSVAEVVEAATQSGLKVEKSWVVVPPGIKSLGRHSLSLRVSSKEFPFTIEVIAK